MNNQYNNTSLVNCPACQNGVSKQAVSCPKCGQPLQFANYQQPFRKSVVVSITIGGFLLAAVYTLSVIPLIIAIPSVLLLLFVSRYVNGNFQN